MFEEYIYTFEQRSKTEEFSGIHCHLLVKPIETRRFGDIKRDLKKIFINYVNVDNMHCLYMKPCNEKLLVDKVNYIVGNKFDEDKHELVENDKNFRKQYNL